MFKFLDYCFIADFLWIILGIFLFIWFFIKRKKKNAKYWGILWLISFAIHHYCWTTSTSIKKRKKKN